MVKIKDQDKNQIAVSFEYELKAWIRRLGSFPIKIIKSAEHSESYEENVMHLWELENGKFALIEEEGCSCYEPSEADIELFPNKEEAINGWNVRVSEKASNGHNVVWLREKIEE